MSEDLLSLFKDRNAGLHKGSFMRYLIPILLLLLLLTPTAAQDDSPLPVLNAEDVLTEGVTVLERLPVFAFDLEKRLVYYFNPETLVWTSYLYPDEVRILNRYTKRNDGTYLLWTGNSDNGRLTSYEDEWLFDPQAGTISRENLYCGRMAALPNEGEWFLHQLETGLYVLCDSETGQQIPIPENIQSDLQCGNRAETSTQSPNREWVSFSDCYDSDAYSINTISNEFHYLGQIHAIYSPYWQWLSDDVVLIQIVYEQSNRTLIDTFIANASEEQSLLSLGFNPDIDIDKSYIAWHEQTSIHESSFQNTIHLLDTTSFEQSIIYEESCTIEQQETCFSASQVALSPSRSYLAIAPSYAQSWGHSNFLLLDRETNEVIYDVADYFSWGISNMNWIDDNRLVFNHLAFVDDIETQSIMLLDLSAQVPLQTLSSSNSILRLAPNDDAILLEASSLLYFPTMQTFEILLPDIEGYVSWNNDSDTSSLIARVTPDCRYPYPCFGGAWRIRIDAVIEEQS